MVRESVAKLKRAVRFLLPEMEEGDGFVAAAPVMELREIFRRFWPYARPYRRWLPLILLFAVLGSAIEAATIWMYKILVDDVLVPQDFGLLLWVVLAYLGLTLAEGVVDFCEDYFSEWVGGRFIVSMRTDVFRHLHDLSMSFFDRRSLGDMLTHLRRHRRDRRAYGLGARPDANLPVPVRLLYRGTLLFAVAAGVGVALRCPAVLARGSILLAEDQSCNPRGRRRTGSVSAVAEESLSNAALVQAYNRQENEVSRFRRENEGSFVADMAAVRLDALFSPSSASSRWPVLAW